MKAPRKPRSKFGPWVRPDREWLEYHYITLGKSARKIAREVGAHHTSVLDWLGDLAVPYREVQKYVDTSTPSGRSQRGDKHYAWTGGRRGYARNLMLRSGIPQVCAKCSFEGPDLIVHHKNEDPRDGSLENLEWLCRSCHYYTHEGGDAQ